MLVDVSIYLYGDNLDPSHVSKILGVDATSSAYKSERRFDPKTGKTYAAQKFGMWELGFGLDSSILSDHIYELASILSLDHVPLLSIDGVEKGEVDIYVSTLIDEGGGGNIQFELNSENISAIEHFSLPVTFTVDFIKP